jgi:Flp pilus assembly protein protease CpaA
LTIPDAIALTGLAVAFVTDVTSWRIPNWLVLMMMAAGFAYNVATGHYLVPILGFAVAFAIHFPLWILKVEKAGDSKLYMGLGAIVGWQLVVETTLYKFVLHIPFGLAILWATGNLRNLPVVTRYALRPQLQQLAQNPALYPTLDRLGLVPAADAGEPPKLTMMFWEPVIAAGYLVARYLAPLTFPWS